MSSPSESRRMMGRGFTSVAEELTPVQRPAKRHAGTVRKPHPGECHERAMRFMSRHGDCIMVTADVTPSRLAHSWVELPEGVVYDGAAGHFFDLGEYRALMTPQREARYTIQDVAERVNRLGWVGDWRNECDV